MPNKFNLKSLLILLSVCMVAAALFFLFAEGDKSTKASGVVFHSENAAAGIRLVDNNLEEDTSTIIGPFQGVQPPSVPCSFCYFLSDGRFFGVQNGVVYFWSGGGELLWKKEMHVHHDVYIDEKEEKIFLVSGELKKIPGKTKLQRSDVIRGMDFRGNEFFVWRLSDNFSQFGKVIGEDVTLHENLSYFEYTHFNSVQEIPENRLESINGAFRKGNILVNDFWNYFAFIIDKDTKKIVWHTKDYPKKLQVHGIRILPTGEMVFFRNSNYGIPPSEDNSSIDFLDPISGVITHSIKLDPKEEYFSKVWGSIQVINEDRFLVTYSEKGIAVEMDRSGKIFWKWRNPITEKGKPKPVYRVSLLSSEGFLKSMLRARSM